jgi:molecular chaperone GrpE
MSSPGPEPGPPKSAAPDRTVSPAEDVGTLAAEEKVSELSILKQSVDDARAQAAAYYDQLLRLKAEFENFRKRAEKEKQDHRRWGKEEVVIQLVDLMDVMEQAQTAAHRASEVKSIVQGLDMLHAKFRRFLEDEGLTEIAAEDRFDPRIHEAVEMVPEPGEEGRILGVLQKGYQFQGNMLRPARVRVSKKPEGPAPVPPE